MCVSFCRLVLDTADCAEQWDYADLPIIDLASAATVEGRIALAGAGTRCNDGPWLLLRDKPRLHI